MLMTFESNNEKKRKTMQPYWLASFKMLITSLQWTPETSLHPIIFSSHSPDHYFTSFPVFLILYNASPTLSQLSKWQGRKRTSPAHPPALVPICLHLCPDTCLLWGNCTKLSVLTVKASTSVWSRPYPPPHSPLSTDSLSCCSFPSAYKQLNQTTLTPTSLQQLPLFPSSLYRQRSPWKSCYSLYSFSLPIFFLTPLQLGPPFLKTDTLKVTVHLDIKNSSMLSSWSSIHVIRCSILIWWSLALPSLKHFVHLVSGHHSLLIFSFLTGHFSVSFSGYFLSLWSLNSGPFGFVHGRVLGVFYPLSTLTPPIMMFVGGGFFLPYPVWGLLTFLNL